MATNRRDVLKYFGATAAAPALFSFGFPGLARAQSSTTLTIAQGNDILSLDPADHANNSTEATLVNLYDYLVNKDFSGETLVFTPNLATSWTTEDQIRWIFDLRDDVKWHDGSPFTAEDVKFTIERTQGDAKLRSTARFRTIKEANVLSPYQIEIITDGRDALLLHSLVGNGAGLLPKAAFEAAASKEAFFENPIGTGPYKFREWRKADRVVLDANTDWWGGTPHWEQIVVRAIPETSTRVAEFITGGVDIAVNIPPEDIARIAADPATQVVSFDIARNIALHVRVAEGSATANPLVREAIDLAINRPELAEFVVEGFAAPTRGLFPPKIPGFNPDLTGDDSTFNPDRARELIAEAGAEGTTITLSSPSGRYVKDREIAEAVVGYLQDIGLDARLEVLDWSVFNSRLNSFELGDMYLWGMGSYTDASILLPRSILNRFNNDWHDATFDGLEAAAAAAPTEEERLAILREGQQIMTDARARIGLLYPQAIYGVNARISFDGRFDEMIPAEGARRV
ncbi:ABC transporter substrate-binding protein [Ketogulonicigenium vulgare]|uniref:Oligopeptide ABC transporter substrate-binding protein n=1 Tax=Ketogulonicigenium vulgare (strain WSH-001) TaxID=759362 RepID=F9Y5T8_KETVW|nr:ABC transporter substrate-binding protein [Ketogulonicigenium vulgare]ADO43748.1 oligopeptide ABC transporter substrate-binding protein [Ketogulonicigenium vulgare Y25]AEM42013.1 Oligopeptide ABC transporter substrate-binding protein [Ketogulonicigenium vulgare WSH-001]ALJ82109.1 peptide ABC transporter substrate-binding protein [Ketogulonicigenium vulgare]ANW34734.1 peptide ABC transporter substrate-binding protein [Ketogulonicigenium vulgare]AOZ55781.1 peptide ABC transporter substrate-bi